jgi:hypothetical protein
VLERPARCGVADDEDALAVKLERDVVEELADALDDLPVALAARVGLVDPAGAFGLDALDRGAVQLAVVALAKPRLEVDGQAGVAERDLRGLSRASEVGDEDGRDAVGAAPLAKPPSLFATVLRQLAVVPAGRDPTLVVDARRVGLVDDLYAQRWPPGESLSSST